MLRTPYFIISLLVAALFLSGCSTSSSYHDQARYSRPQMYHVDAKVLSQQPQAERCSYVDQGGGSSAGTVIGTVGGALLGRQFGGSKNARNWGTAAGALLGGSMGASVDRNRRDPRDVPKLACQSDGWLVTVGFMHPVTQVYQVMTVPLDRPVRAEYLSIPVR